MHEVIIKGSLQIKFPPIWTHEKQRCEESESSRQYGHMKSRDVKSQRGKSEENIREEKKREEKKREEKRRKEKRKEEKRRKKRGSTCLTR